MADATFSADLEAIWNDAIKAYQDEVGYDSTISDALEKKITTVEQLGEYIESKGDAFKSFRSKHKKVYEKVQLLIGPMEFLAKVTSPLSNEPTWGIPLSIITAGVAHLFQAGNGVADSYDWIEQVFAELLTFSRSIKGRMQPPVDNVMRRQVAQILSFIIRIMGRSRRLIQDRHFKQYLRVAFLGEDKKTKALTEQLNRLLESNDSLTLSLTYEKVGGIAANVDESNAITKATATTLDQVHDKVNDLAAVISKGNAIAEVAAATTAELSTQKLDDSMRENMKASFRTQAFDDNTYWLSEHTRGLLTGSGSWLSQERLYKKWKTKGALVLWVLGPPGSGKSMLCTWIIHQLRSEYDLAEAADTENVNLAYFYMRQNIKGLGTISSLFKTMIWQLQENDLAFQVHVAQQCRSSYKIAGPEQIWENCFLNYYTSDKSAGRRAVLVIDGLDEIEPTERKILLDIIDKYRNNVAASHKAIQFAIFGREELKDDLRRAGLDNDRHVIRVSSDKNSRDLREYIKSRVQKLEIIVNGKKASSSTRQEEANKRAKQLQKQIYDLADGVFLWAQIFLDQMQNQEWSVIRKLLKNPPPKLDDMILTVLTRLSQEVQVSGNATDPANVHDLEQILLWVCECKRPLKFLELEYILRMKDDEPRRLLWDKLRDKWTSVLTLRYPRNYDPDAVEETDEQDHEQLELGDTPSEIADSEADTAVYNDDSDSHARDTDSDAFADDDDSLSVGSDETVESDSDSMQLERKGSTAVLRQYDKGQLYTLVGFAHARFRDVVREQGDAAFKGNPTLSIFQSVRQADYWLFLDCTRMIEKSMEEEMSNQPLYLDYPTANIFQHLEAVRYDELDVQQRSRVVKELCWLFNSVQGCTAFFMGLGERDGGRVDDFWRLLFTDQKYMKLVQDWFKRVPYLGRKEEIDWIKQAAESIEILLKPMAEIAAQRWLEKDGYDDAAYLDKSFFEVWFLKAYTDLASTGELSDSCKNFNWSINGANAGLNPTELIALADWADLEKTTHWYTGVGWILFWTDWDDIALEYCSKAIELDDGAWIAMEASARILGGQGKYVEAIEKINLAMDKMPETPHLSGVKSYLQSYSATWNAKLGNDEECARLAREAFYANYVSIPAINTFVDVLYRGKLWEELRYTLSFLDGVIWSHDKSLLSHWFVTYGYIPWSVEYMCSVSDNIGFVLEAAQAAVPDVEAARVEVNTAYYIFDLANCYYSFARDERKFIDLYDDAVARLASSGSSESNKSTDYQRRLKPLYTRVSFDMAVAQNKVVRTSNKPAIRLKELAMITGSTSEETSKSVFEIYADDYSSLLWGRWLREYVKADEYTWKQCFRSRVLALMAGLDDDDPDNDTSACASLAVALFQAGDRESAAEILAVLFKPLEELMQQDQAEQDNQQEENNGEENREAEEGTQSETGEQQELALVIADPTPSDFGQSQTVHEISLDDTPIAEAINSTQALHIDEPADVELDDTLSHRSLNTARAPSVRGLETETDANESQPTDTASEHGIDDPKPKEPMVAGQTGSEDRHSEETQNGALELHLVNSWSYTCDWCGENARQAKSMWFCEICYNTNFCSECLECIKKGSLGKYLCNTTHQWYQAYPIPEQYSNKMVLSQSSNTAVLKKEWLDNLREKWLIDVLVVHPDH